MKRVLLLVCLVFLLTGCVRVEKNDDYIGLINDCMNSNTITNDVALGYKFYVPRGVKLIQSYDYNQVFMVENNNLYLYVDIISYFYKNKLNYKENLVYNYYYQEFSFDNNDGYIVINEEDNSYYYVKIIYNYAKIEFYTDKDNLSKLIIYSSIILNNINYNDIAIENILENESGSSSNIMYELEKPEESGSNFSQYLEEYVQEDNEEEEQILPDE